MTIFSTLNYSTYHSKYLKYFTDCFSTPDRDQDTYSEYHCAKEWAAGWWFANCWFVILNGQYYNHTQVEYRGISWNEWKNEQLMKVEMKIRPSSL